MLILIYIDYKYKHNPEEDSIYPLYNVTSGVQTIAGVMLNDVRPK